MLLTNLQNLAAALQEIVTLAPQVITALTDLNNFLSSV